MHVFVAGATGVIGLRVVRLLVAEGHVVAGMTRTPSNEDRLRELGAEAVVCDVFDVATLNETVSGFAPDVVMHQLTDLPTHPRVQIDDAARQTLRARFTDAPSGEKHAARDAGRQDVTLLVYSST